MIKSAVREETELKCENCGVDVYRCYICEEYFYKDELVYCNDSKHFCDSCFEEQNKK